MSREMSSDAVLMKNASNANQSQRKTILGLGVACVDIIACVDTYPEPDEKIRAESVQLFSGGNVGNTLTAISRLGAANAKVLTKVGSDPNGELILSDFRNAMVDVEDVIISPTAPTLLVYVIVDKQARRTCIASPNEEELTQSEIVSKLSISSQISVSTESSALFDNVQVYSF
jgi:sugar/nucleoside kinase (ribokinase family)